MSTQIRLTDDLRWEPRSGTYRFDLDGIDGDSTSLAIVDCIARLVKAEPHRLDPLARYIDTDALDALFDRWADDPPPGGGELTFRYQGFVVAVSTDGTLRVRPVAGAPSASSGPSADV